MIMTNKFYTVEEASDRWQVKGRGLYAQPDFASFDHINREYKNINGFYITTEEDNENRLYFYIDFNFNTYTDTCGDKITPRYYTDTDILARCPSNNGLYLVRVDEDTKTVYIKDLNCKTVKDFYN